MPRNTRKSAAADPTAPSILPVMHRERVHLILPDSRLFLMTLPDNLKDLENFVKSKMAAQSTAAGGGGDMMKFTVEDAEISSCAVLRDGDIVKVVLEKAPVPKGPLIMVRVKFLTGVCFDVSINKNATIADLKARICSREGIDITFIKRLVYNKVPLEDAQKVCDTGLTMGSHIYITLRF